MTTPLFVMQQRSSAKYQNLAPQIREWAEALKCVLSRMVVLCVEIIDELSRVSMSDNRVLFCGVFCVRYKARVLAQRNGTDIDEASKQLNKDLLDMHTSILKQNRLWPWWAWVQLPLFAQIPVRNTCV